MYEYLDRIYAYALYEIAEEKGRVEEYVGELRMICHLIENDKDFMEVIKHTQISTKQKKDTFINIFKGNIDEDLLRGCIQTEFINSIWYSSFIFYRMFIIKVFCRKGTL